MRSWLLREQLRASELARMDAEQQTRIDRVQNEKLQRDVQQLQGSLKDAEFAASSAMQLVNLVHGKWVDDEQRLVAEGQLAAPQQEPLAPAQIEQLRKQLRQPTWLLVSRCRRRQ